MILVSVGTNEAAFDRLLEWVAALGFEEEMVVQHGPSPVRPAGARCVAYLPYEDLVPLVQESRVFVSHAGVGSIMTSLAAGRQPVVVPRLKRFREAVDDHQVALARRLHDDRLVTLAGDASELAGAVAGTDHRFDRAVGGTALQHEIGVVGVLTEVRPRAAWGWSVRKVKGDHRKVLARLVGASAAFSRLDLQLGEIWRGRARPVAT